jgi:hypothetical protein
MKATVAKSSFVPIRVIQSMMTKRPELRHLADTVPSQIAKQAKQILLLY